MKAKDIKISVVSPQVANEFIKRVHYSGKVVPNSQLHLGAYLNNELHGVMQFGPPTDKRKLIGLVENTGWNGFLELNRMAFDEALPKNSESRALAIAMRLIRKNATHIEWVVSFADATQCGDGTIYRAAGFVLTAIKKNSGMRIDEQGNVHSQVTFSAHRPNEMHKFREMEVLPGYQLRYIYFVKPEAKERLTVPIVPFDEIKKVGASMYKGKKV